MCTRIEVLYKPSNLIPCIYMQGWETDNTIVESDTWQNVDRESQHEEGEI